MTPELSQLQAQIHNALDATLPKSSAIAQPMLDAMRHAVLGGGKRLRPLLVCSTSRALGGTDEAAFPAACAVEFIHAYSLIHDDLPAMDDDELRHGLPSAHVEYGEANAILAGDSLHSLAFQTLVNATTLPSDTRLTMVRLLSEAAGWAGMAGGQCLDIESEGKSLEMAELKQLHGAKTGALIRVSVQLGALCVPHMTLEDPRFASLTEFGDRIGLAFQVMDDVLDVTQSSEQLGKPAGSDEALEKSTFPKLIGIEGARDLAHKLVADAHLSLAACELANTPLADLADLVVNRDH